MDVIMLLSLFLLGQYYILWWIVKLCLLLVCLCRDATALRVDARVSHEHVSCGHGEYPSGVVFDVSIFIQVLMLNYLCHTCSSSRVALVCLLPFCSTFSFLSGNIQEKLSVVVCALGGKEGSKTTTRSSVAVFENKHARRSVCPVNRHTIRRRRVSKDGALVVLTFFCYLL